MAEAVTSAAKADMTGGVAWTKYLDHTLRRGVDFKRASKVPRPAGKNSSAKGLWIGRTADHAVHNYYQTDPKKKKRRKKPCPRLARIIAHIEQELGLVNIQTQYPVALTFEGHKLVTWIDMVALKPGHHDKRTRQYVPPKIVVVELKCTQHTLDQHRQLYNLDCGAKKLANHLPDTEKMHHLLQTALGVLGFRQRVGSACQYPVCGRVVVSCSDGEISYNCDDTMIRRNHFSIKPLKGAKKTKVTQGIQLMEMPSDPDERQEIIAALCTKMAGFTECVDVHKCKTSFVARNPKTSRCAAVSIMNDPTDAAPTSAKYKRVRKHTLEQASSHRCLAIVMTRGSKGFVVRSLRRGR